jgi:hypothetical protein
VSCGSRSRPEFSLDVGCGYLNRIIVVACHSAGVAWEREHPFVGADALAAETLNRHALRTRFRPILPGVYLPASVEPTLRQRTQAAWLWSRGNGVIAGLAASAMLGARWVDDATAVEVICANTRPPQGVRTRNDSLLEGEVRTLSGIRVTTAERTSFDLARRGSVGVAVARLDALLRATGCTPAEVERLAARHPRVRGLRQLEEVLQLVDAGAESPKETWLRLLLRRAGLPTPNTQIEVLDDNGYPVARLDMGWRDVMVAVEYDGDQHRTDRWQYVKDLRRVEMLERMGWLIVRVVNEDSPADIVRRVRRALDSRC